MLGIAKVFKSVSDFIVNYRTRALPAKFEGKLRTEIAAKKCANCAAPVGPRPFRDRDFPGRYYCSLDCRNTALIARDRDLDEKMARQPAPLNEGEQALLVGKSSPGMHYEPGRCVRCGEALQDGGAIFGFCSEKCEEQAMKPYVSFTEQLVDSDEYKNASKDRDDFARKDPEIIEEVKKRCENASMTDGEIQAYLDQQIKHAELLHDRRKSFDYGEARVRFLAKWELQRAYVLEQEKRSAANRPEAP